MSHLRRAGRRSLAGVCLAAVLASSCGPFIDPAGAFATEVHPLLTTSCTPCHSGDQSISERGPGGFANADAGAAYTALQDYLVPGDAEGSPIMVRLTAAPFMPPTPAEPLDDVSAIAAWIDDGAKP